jgi:pectinesterase
MNFPFINAARTCALGLVLIAFGSAAALAKDIIVDPSGSGDFKTVQEALDSVEKGNTEPARILIKPGKYEEHLAIPKDKPHVQLIGQGAKPDDTTITFHLKASDPKPDGTGNVGTTGSSSVTVNGPDFLAENITFANSAGAGAGQAVAVKTNGDRLVFRNCRFLGHQDTLYPSGKGRCYFKDCYIAGDTDFIFGNAVAVFDHCTIESVGRGFDSAANTSPEQPYGYVFLDCTLIASADVPAGSVFLGRPWQWNSGPHPAVAYLRTKMGPHISPAGWNPWDKANTDPAKTARYSEYKSMDPDGQPLDVSKRVDWSHQLTDDEAAKYTIPNILAGDDHWDPTAVTSK